MGSFLAKTNHEFEKILENTNKIKNFDVIEFFFKNILQMAMIFVVNELF